MLFGPEAEVASGAEADTQDDAVSVEVDVDEKSESEHEMTIDEDIRRRVDAEFDEGKVERLSGSAVIDNPEAERRRREVENEEWKQRECERLMRERKEWLSREGKAPVDAGRHENEVQLKLKQGAVRLAAEKIIHNVKARIDRRTVLAEEMLDAIDRDDMEKRKRIRALPPGDFGDVITPEELDFIQTGKPMSEARVLTDLAFNILMALTGRDLHGYALVKRLRELDEREGKERKKRK